MRHIKPLFISLWGRPSLKSQSAVDPTQRSMMDPTRVLKISNFPTLPDIDVSHGDRAIPPRTDAKSSSSSYLIHKGRAVEMIKRCVSIEGLTLSKGWTAEATQAFMLAIEAVVRANPILTGKLIEEKNQPWHWIRHGNLRIIPNAFPPEKHSFVTVVDPPPDMATPGQAMQDEMTGDESAKDLFHYVHSNVAEYLLGEASFSSDQIRDGSPLFEAKIMDFGDGYAAYSVRLSHAIGDGTTYFQLVSQISSFMSGLTPSKIDWDNPLKATHEIYPENFSERDYQRSYGLPFGWGLFKNLRTLSKRKCKYLLLSKEKIAKKKKVLQQTDADDGGSISANDIIMSCLCEMCGSSDIFAFDRSVRGIKEGVSKSSAGNFFWEIPFEREHGTNPFEIRNILSSDEGSYFATDGIPLMPFLNGRVGRITSLASITRHQTTFPGTESICQFPSASFIKDLPLDVAVIFRFDKNNWGVMHNFRKVNKSPLLEEIMA